MENQLFPVAISEKQFMRQYERAKKVVDKGIDSYFILFDNDAFSNVSEIGNTTLKDIAACIGKEYPVFFRFGGYFYCDDDKECRENYQTFLIRPIFKRDKGYLRQAYRFIPQECWICEWVDATGAALLMPFTQKDNGDLVFLKNNPLCVRHKRSTKDDCITVPEAYLKRVIELMPDYYDSLFAVVRYRHVDIAIPIEKDSAKKTFKNREKDADGVKRHLVHNVREHGRVTLKNADHVETHLRGRSDFTINGIDVSLMASWEWSVRELKRNKEKKGGKL